MSGTIKIPAMPEPLAYWFRHINTDGEPTTQWTPVEPRNPHMNTVHDSVKELLAYRYQGKPCYEVAAVHTADQLAARDAQWQEMAGPVVDAARKLMTMRVGELPHTGYLRDNDISRAALGDLNRALSAITEE